MSHNVCPVWVGYFLVNPLRKLIQNPEKILSGHIKKGMKVMDIGPGMGYFSIPMAKMTGSTGNVICVDIQERMLNKLHKRAEKKGVGDIIRSVISNEDSLNIDNYQNEMDFVLAFAVIHEVKDREKVFSEIFNSLKSDGHLLFCEPSGHVSKEDFEESVDYAKWCGFKVEELPDVKSGLSVLLKK